MPPELSAFDRSKWTASIESPVTWAIVSIGILIYNILSAIVVCVFISVSANHLSYAGARFMVIFCKSLVLF